MPDLVPTDSELQGMADRLRSAVHARRVALGAAGTMTAAKAAVLAEIVAKLDALQRELDGGEEEA